jgi:tetratricopeptide (TPR) repeat protein
MGKTLYQLGYYSASLSYFERIVGKGAAHSYYNATLKWLASLSRKLPESAGILEQIGKYQRDVLDTPDLQPVRDELYYLLGRWFYTQGKFGDAVSLFAAVPAESEFYAKAKFFEGITHVREYNAKPATEAFKAILRRAQEKTRDKSIAEYVELANLSLARVFYSTSQFELSAKYFDKIPQDSPDWLSSLFESSWAQYQLGLGGYSKALGNIHTLNAPYFEQEFFPESLILKAVIYFYACMYDRSREALAEFNTLYPDLKKGLEDILAGHPDNAEFYEYMLKIRKGSSGLPERTERLARGALQDRTLRKNIAYVEELDRELKQVEEADAAWRSTAIAATILEDLMLKKSLAVNEAGNMARQRLTRMTTEIAELVRQAM